MKYQTPIPTPEWCSCSKSTKKVPGMEKEGSQSQTSQLPAVVLKKVPPQCHNKTVPVLSPAAWYVLWNLFSIAYNFSNMKPFKWKSPTLETDFTGLHPRDTSHNTDWVFSRTKTKRKGEEGFLHITAELNFKISSDRVRKLFSEAEIWRSAEPTHGLTFLSHFLIPYVTAPCLEFICTFGFLCLLPLPPS